MDVLILAAEGDAGPGMGPPAHSGAVSPVTVHGWSSVVHRMIGDPPPVAFVICAEMVTDRGVDVVRTLHRRGFLVPTAVYFASVDARLIERAWRLGRFGVEPLFGAAAGQRIMALADNDQAAVADYVCGRLEIDSALSRRLLHVLGGGGAVLSEAVGDVAARLGVSRTTLYETSRRSGLPGIEHCQALFRLLDAARILQRGGRPEDAAYAACLAESRSLRSALANRIGLSITEVRERPGWRWIADRWIERHCARPGGR